MLTKTKALCLSLVHFKESAAIVQAYTADFGRQSFMVYGVRSKQAKSNKIALFQPLTQLELEIWQRPNRDLHRINEARLYYAYRTVTTSPKKIAVAFFLTEILYKVLKPEEADLPLFNFLCEALQTYDALPAGGENFHLQFLLRLPEYLGFGLQHATELAEPLPDLQFSGATTLALAEQLRASTFQEPVLLTLAQRREILALLVRFYQYHFENFGELKSWDVLRELQF